MKHTKEYIPEKYKYAVQEIADSLLAGFVCYFNLDSLEVESLPKMLLEDPEEYELMTGESWESEEKKHEKWKNYIEIAPLDSSEAFRIMENFAEQVEDQHIQNKLISALNNRRPFANFKMLVESSEYREHWFQFRQQAYERHVWDQIQLNSEELD